MRCAEKQLLPVPVINRALKLDPSTDLTRKPSRTDDVKHGHEADQEEKNIKATGVEGKRVAMRGEQRLEKVLNRFRQALAFGPSYIESTTQ